MRDIVERLRRFKTGCDKPECARMIFTPLVCEEAADEIKRLRAGLFDCLQEAANHHRENQVRAKIGGSDIAQRKAKAIVARSGVLLHNIKTIARAALEQEKGGQ